VSGFSMMRFLHGPSPEAPRGRASGSAAPSPFPPGTLQTMRDETDEESPPEVALPPSWDKLVSSDSHIRAEVDRNRYVRGIPSIRAPMTVSAVTGWRCLRGCRI